jgi:hypothetical protein
MGEDGRPGPDALLRGLRDSARRCAAAPPAERPALRARRTAEREEVIAATLPAATLLDHLAETEHRLERLAGEAGQAALTSGEILAIRGDLAWLPLALPGEALDETLAGLRTDLALEEHTTEALPPEDRERTAPALAAVRETLRTAERARLETMLDRLSAKPPPPSERFLSTYREALDLAPRGSEEQALLQRARGLLEEHVAALPPAEAADLLTTLAEEEEDVALDLTALSAELAPAEAARALASGRGEPRWAERLVRDAARRTPRKERRTRRQFRRAGRRLRRASARLAREAQEQQLAGRLEGIFGHRFVAIFENLILWLILAVLGVLIAEAFLPQERVSPIVDRHFAEEGEPVRHWHPLLLALAWIDAGICAIFLLEFFTKLALVRGRLRWFLRHFIVDLVPSIPYGLITIHALDVLRAVRAARFLRLTRVLRYVRAARPIVRFIRFFGFLQRAMDRLVRLHGNLLNRNVVLFEPAGSEGDAATAADPAARLRRVRAVARMAWRRVSRELPARERAEAVGEWLSDLPGTARLTALPPAPDGGRRRGQEVLRAEELLRLLTDLDAGSVEAALGPAGADRIAATLDRLDVPVLRRIPILHAMVLAARTREPLEAVARAGRALGRVLERLLGRVQWLADLSGVISGPQFLDGFGSGLARAAGRPARRLLIFGFFFLLLKGFVELLGFSGLGGITDWLSRTLGAPFLILGGACLVVYVLGAWFRRVAGEATDFYTRTAEAQYICLLKSAKRQSISEDLACLDDRVLRPESLLAGVFESGDPERLRHVLEEGSIPGRFSRDERVLQLYQDYLDGALFHVSDTKTTGQLLGNLSLEHIRAERLGTTKEDRKRLGELDLARERGGLRGPHLWFRSITHTVAQWTAKLIVDYNRHAIPLAVRDRSTQAEVRTMDEWLDHRLSGERPARENEADPGAFATTFFHALHFLDADGERDRAVTETFGERTLLALRADRKAMIRTIFGTYPFHRTARPDRTLNPYELYSRHIAGGRTVLIPLHIVRLALRAVRWLLRRIRSTLGEVLHPRLVLGDSRRNWAPFEVAERKIHRMRKPLYMECARFRALFDPEYLGLSLRHDRDSGLEGRGFREDLDRIGARGDERDAFEDLRREREEALRSFAPIVSTAGGPDSFARGLRGDSGGAGAVPEAYRATAIAWAIDYRSVRTLHSLTPQARDIVGAIVRCGGRVPGTGLLRRALRALMPARGIERAAREFLRRHVPGTDDAKAIRWFVRAVRADWRSLRRLVALGTSLVPGTTPEEAAMDVLRQVARHPESWSDQLVTLRAVQSLSAIDVGNYRRQVHVLGGYGNE